MESFSSADLIADSFGFCFGLLLQDEVFSDETGKEIFKDHRS